MCSMGDFINASHTRHYDSPMDDRVKLCSSQMPAPGSVEAEHMADKHDAYMAIVGSILWLANMTMPQLSYAASQLARFVSNPAKVHMNAAIRVLIYLSGCLDYTLHFRPSTAPFYICTDSNWETRFSCCGAILYYLGCPFAWFAKTQRSVALSSAEAEYFGAMLAAKEGLFIREVLEDLGRRILGPTFIYTDSQATVELSIDAVAFKKTKHILRAAEFLRDLVLRRVFYLAHIRGTSNPADVMTKPLPRGTFVQVIKLISEFSGNVNADGDGAP